MPQDSPQDPVINDSENDNLKTSTVSVNDYFNRKIKKMNKGIDLKHKLESAEEHEEDDNVSFIPFKNQENRPDDGESTMCEPSGTIRDNLKIKKAKKKLKKPKS